MMARLSRRLTPEKGYVSRGSAADRKNSRAGQCLAVRAACQGGGCGGAAAVLSARGQPLRKQYPCIGSILHTRDVQGFLATFFPHLHHIHQLLRGQGQQERCGHRRLLRLAARLPLAAAGLRIHLVTRDLSLSMRLLLPLCLQLLLPLRRSSRLPGVPAAAASSLARGCRWVRGRGCRR
jgi:hypothetical protein